MTESYPLTSIPPPVYHPPAHDGDYPPATGVPQQEEALPAYSGRAPEIAYVPRDADIERQKFYYNPPTKRASGTQGICICLVISAIVTAIIIAVAITVTHRNSSGYSD